MILRTFAGSSEGGVGLLAKQGLDPLSLGIMSLSRGRLHPLLHFNRGWELNVVVQVQEKHLFPEGWISETLNSPLY